MEVLIGVPVLLVGTLFPILARAAATDHERLRAAVERTLEVMLMCGALVALTVVAGAPVAIAILVGGDADPAVDALAILGVGLGFSFIGATCQFTLLALREHRSIFFINALALAVNVGLTLVLANEHGATGAAVALSSSEAVVAVASLAVAAIRAHVQPVGAHPGRHRARDGGGRGGRAGRCDCEPGRCGDGRRGGVRRDPGRARGGSARAARSMPGRGRPA